MDRVSMKDAVRRSKCVMDLRKKLDKKRMCDDKKRMCDFNAFKRERRSVFNEQLRDQQCQRMRRGNSRYIPPHLRTC